MSDCTIRSSWNFSKQLGLGSVEVSYSHPPEESWLLPRLEGEPLRHLNETLSGLNRLLYGSQDYAIIGRK